MGSITGALSSVNNPLQNEISNFSTARVASSTPGAYATASRGSSSSDTVNLSEFARMFQQLSLQTLNPAEFAKVTTEAASKLD